MREHATVWPRTAIANISLAIFSSVQLSLNESTVKSSSVDAVHIWSRRRGLPMSRARQMLGNGQQSLLVSILLPKRRTISTNITMHADYAENPLNKAHQDNSHMHKFTAVAVICANVVMLHYITLPAPLQDGARRCQRRRHFHHQHFMCNSLYIYIHLYVYIMHKLDVIFILPLVCTLQFIVAQSSSTAVHANQIALKNIYNTNIYTDILYNICVPSCRHVTNISTTTSTSNCRLCTAEPGHMWDGRMRQWTGAEWHACTAHRHIISYYNKIPLAWNCHKRVPLRVPSPELWTACLCPSLPFSIFLPLLLWKWQQQQQHQMLEKKNFEILISQIVFTASARRASSYICSS